LQKVFFLNIWRTFSDWIGTNDQSKSLGEGLRKFLISNLKLDFSLQIHLCQTNQVKNSLTTFRNGNFRISFWKFIPSHKKFFLRFCHPTSLIHSQGHPSIWECQILFQLTELFPRGKYFELNNEFSQMLLFKLAIYCSLKDSQSNTNKLRNKIHFSHLSDETFSTFWTGKAIDTVLLEWAGWLPSKKKLWERKCLKNRIKNIFKMLKREESIEKLVNRKSKEITVALSFKF